MCSRGNTGSLAAHSVGPAGTWHVQQEGHDYLNWLRSRVFVAQDQRALTLMKVSFKVMALRVKVPRAEV